MLAPAGVLAEVNEDLITCHLTKLETALDQMKKAHPKMKPVDAALLASALSLTGRHAIALYEGGEYKWPSDTQGLAAAIAGELRIAKEALEGVKKAKAGVEEEPIQINLGLMPNFSAGEAILGDRNDLKTKLGDILNDGVEFAYSNTDIGWQWAMDRTNWNIVLGEELPRKVKVKAQFTQGAIGVETGTTTKKKAGSRSKAAAVVEAEPEAEVEAEAEAVAE